MFVALLNVVQSCLVSGDLYKANSLSFFFFLSREAAWTEIGEQNPQLTIMKKLKLIMLILWKRISRTFIGAFHKYDQ